MHPRKTFQGLIYQDQFYNDDIHKIVGIDEVGRGCLFGPVVACAVILPKEYKNNKINDSKLISKKDREILSKEILENCLAYGIGVVDAQKIDEINILEASKLAMKNALNNIKIEYDLILVDAVKLNDTQVKSISIIKGDALALPIAAASIVAKVYRDNLLDELDILYPHYDLKHNKGYGTKKHLEALKIYGPINNFHRFSFKPIKK